MEDDGFVDFIEKDEVPNERRKRCSCSDLTVIMNYIQAE